MPLAGPGSQVNVAQLFDLQNENHHHSREQAVVG
jgi:hypothetical protein